MQNYKKNFVTRTLAWVLAAVMVIAMVPVGVFAETYTEDGHIKTTDWSEKAMKEREAKTGSWPLAMKNRLVRVSFADPVKTPDINYVGVYTNADGREVVRLAFNAFTTAANQWDKLLIRLPSELAAIFDQKNPQSGIYKGANSYGNHDMMDMDWIKKTLSEAKVPLEPLAWNVAGGQNVYAVDLYKNGTFGGNAKLNIPIDLVLKEGKSIKDFKSDLLVQARLTDKKFERVYMRAGERTNDYMQYTFSTIIPHENNYGIYLNKDLSNVGPTNPAATYNKFFSTVSSVKFNEEKGYLEVYIRHNKWDTGDGYALRQAVESDFFDLLDDREGMVGEVYLMSAGAKPYSPTKEEPYEPTTKIQFAESDIYKDDQTKIGFIQLAGSEWDNSKEYEKGIVTKKSSNVKSKDAILNGTSAQFNPGVYTVVRYFIKPTELKKLIKDNGLKSYTFRSSFLRENKNRYSSGKRTTGTSVFTFTNDKDRVFKRGDKVKLEFNQAQYNRVAATYVTRPEIIIGDDNYNINFINSIEYDSTGKEATWTVPFDLKIKVGEKVTIKSTEWEDDNRATQLKITFKDLDSIKLTKENKEVSYAPIEMLYSASLTGGALTSTTARPNVDEIFTDSTNITGHSHFDGAEINIKYVDKNGEEVKQTISAAGATDLNPDKVDYSKILTKARFVNGEEVDAFPFDTTKPNNGGAIQGDKKFEEFKMPTLERDMPIKVDNLDVLSSFIPSGDVVEQVQTKFHFDLNGVKSKTNLDVLDKIAPLSKEYKYDPETGKANDKYKASGFEGDNVKYVDDANKTIEVDGRTYQNIQNHDGLEYDLKIKDQKEAFLMRQMPTKDDVDVPQGKRILGWTTKKLVDTNDKTVVDQFNELKDAGKIVKDVADWANVDKDQTYIFDANSPIDKERTVYAVYGEGINIVLHSNNTDDLKDEKTIIIPINASDIDKTSKTLDAVSSPTITNMKGKLVIKELPKVPVTGEQDEIDKIADADAKLFSKAKNSFVGWTTKRYANDDSTEFAAGNNNERIGEITQGLVENGTKRIPQKTEWLKDLNTVQNKYYVPNGYSVAVRPEDVDKSFKDAEMLKAIEEGQDIHLYANYRPFFNVNVIASYKNIDKAQGTYGKYVDDVDSSKKKAANIGLLRRTAVTPYGTPTVHQNANYYPFEGGLKAWTGNEETLTWEVPGFDELGQRMSYVSVVVPNGKEQAYKDFAVPNWGDLGMKTYLRINNTNGTITHEPTAPRNLHENAGNPYGDYLAKDQAFDLGLDAYTSATSRNAKTADRNGTDEVVGYTIWNTSTPIDIPKPVFDKVYDTDTEVKLKWEAVEKNADIKKIKLTIADDAEVILERQDDGSYKTADGTLTATPEGDKLVIKTVDLTGKGGKNIIAKYVVEKAGQEKEGPQGDIQINTKGNSAPVERMKQTTNDTDGNPVIEFDIPNPVINKPVKDTVYKVQKWDDTNKKWVDVPNAEYTMTDKDKLGDTKTIVLPKKDNTNPNGVENDDIIRIVSKQPDSNESASTQTMDKLGNITGNFDDGIDNNSVKDRDYVELDMVGPEIIKDKAEDEAFRRFIDISAAIKEIPEGRKVTVEVAYPDGEKVNKTFEISVDNPDEDKAYAIEYLNNVLRKGAETNQVPTIKLTAVDEYGNKAEKEVDYTATNVLEVKIKGERAGKKFIKVTADKADAEVTVKVVNSQGDEVATGTARVATAGEFVKLTFSQDYRLQSGDTLVISGKVTEGGKTYTSNPFKRAIK
ncbi:MAG: hypothetical protein SPI61_03970 [Ezakiella sp.]|uniref:hypothetical protein n=1 Tax=Ezakiella sp. TaxID=1935205 RepID=UPI0029707BB6|nr:hypothetical protein [Ezakiella sp.]MDD7730712.1 hypothetical protein [Eubacteriales bacterium]MDY6079856.1 hypothetical protein [Ezakiella sp.]